MRFLQFSIREGNCLSQKQHVHDCLLNDQICLFIISVSSLQCDHGWVLPIWLQRRGIGLIEACYLQEKCLQLDLRCERRCDIISCSLMRRGYSGAAASVLKEVCLGRSVTVI